MSIEKSSLIKFEYKINLKSGIVNANWKIPSFLARFTDLMLTKMPKQSNVTYANTGFTQNIVTLTIMTRNTFKIQMALGFVLPVAVLSLFGSLNNSIFLPLLW